MAGRTAVCTLRGERRRHGRRSNKNQGVVGQDGPTWDHQLTLIVDMEEPALLVVATETYQHLIGRAAGRLVGLPVSEDSQFPGRLLRAVPKGVRKQCL